MTLSVIPRKFKALVWHLFPPSLDEMLYTIGEGVYHDPNRKGNNRIAVMAVRTGGEPFLEGLVHILQKDYRLDVFGFPVDVSRDNKKIKRGSIKKYVPKLPGRFLYVLDESAATGLVQEAVDYYFRLDGTGKFRHGVTGINYIALTDYTGKANISFFPITRK